MVICSSRLKSRLLLPPSTRPVTGSDGPMRADVESADAVFAAEEQLLEDRQCVEPGERVDVFDLRAHAERQRGVLLPEPHALEHRLVEVGVAAEAGEIDGRREALALGREDRLVDRVVDEARRRSC